MINAPIETQKVVTRTADGLNFPTPSALTWWPDDPAAVQMRTTCGRTRDVEIWFFARQLITAALAVPGGAFGQGNVAAAVEDQIIIFRLSHDGQHAYVTWPLAAVTDWHTRTVANCAPGSEDEGARYTARLDAELQQLRRDEETS